MSRKLLLTFSVFILSVGGIVWACGGGDYDENDYSSFSPEAFVDHQYSPFFYSGYTSYYSDSLDDSNTRYNTVIVEEWNAYLSGKPDKATLRTLLFSTSLHGLDSVAAYLGGRENLLPRQLSALKVTRPNTRQMHMFMDYLRLAKKCEDFTVNEMRYSWDDKVVPKVPAAALKEEITAALKQAKDPFIRERLWFQLLRYHYFAELQDSSRVSAGSEVVETFDQYAATFPKNMVYYRALGYLAGHYYKKREYARANYLYSLCFSYSAQMKIPSKWSFHPQNESDWQQSLQMAQSREERIVLWQMLGIYSDEERAIEKIYSLDPRSDKMELLLSRLVNHMEIPTYTNSTDSTAMAEKRLLVHNQQLIGSIAAKNNTAKPYFWNLAAGYLYSLSGEAGRAQKYYDKAKTQLPKNDKLVAAQHKLLNWTLYLSQLQRIDAHTETQMVEPLNWLADLRDGKDTIAHLRYYVALSQSVRVLSNLYRKQGEDLKATCFADDKVEFYTSNARIEAMKTLLGKTRHTPFETAMLRYYKITLEDLNYHQGTMLVYQEKTDQAIAYFQKSGKGALAVLPANPFSIHIYDCHDCDFQLPQKVKYTPLSFLKTIKQLKTDIVAGKNAYVNAFLLADAYYNITHYGNARLFYESDITQTNSAISPIDIPVAFRTPLTSCKLAEKYYLLARSYAKTKDQKARCTYMAAKCERNEIYNAVYNNEANKNKYSWDFDINNIPVGKYFAELKSGYAATPYYKEILKECGYFRTYDRKH